MTWKARVVLSECELSRLLEMGGEAVTEYLLDGPSDTGYLLEGIADLLC